MIRRSFLKACGAFLAMVPAALSSIGRHRSLFVNSRFGKDSVCAGNSPHQPLASLRKALEMAGHGDCIYLAPGHAEHLSKTLCFDKPGVKAIGDQKGRPTFSYGSDLLCVVDVQADCEIKNFDFVLQEDC